MRQVHVKTGLWVSRCIGCPWRVCRPIPQHLTPSHFTLRAHSGGHIPQFCGYARCPLTVFPFFTDSNAHSQGAIPVSKSSLISYMLSLPGVGVAFPHLPMIHETAVKRGATPFVKGSCNHNEKKSRPQGCAWRNGHQLGRGGIHRWAFISRLLCGLRSGLLPCGLCCAKAVLVEWEKQPHLGGGLGTAP